MAIDQSKKKKKKIKQRINLWKWKWLDNEKKDCKRIGLVRRNWGMMMRSERRWNQQNDETSFTGKSVVAQKNKLNDEVSVC